MLGFSWLQLLQTWCYVSVWQLKCDWQVVTWYHSRHASSGVCVLAKAWKLFESIQSLCVQQFNKEYVALMWSYILNSFTLFELPVWLFTNRLLLFQQCYSSEYLVLSHHPGRPGTESAHPETGQGSETGGTAWTAGRTPAGQTTGTWGTSEDQTPPLSRHTTSSCLSHQPVH